MNVLNDTFIEYCSQPIITKTIVQNSKNEKFFVQTFEHNYSSECSEIIVA